MEIIYKHTQIGYVIISVFLFILFLFVPIFTQNINKPIPTIVLIAFIAIFFLFPTLTVTVNKEKINLAFGIGLIKKNFNITEIDSFTKVKNPWIYGWGIHYTPGGWLYNVSGFNAIEIKLKSGKKYRIGTDEPSQLFDAIASAVDK